MCRIKSHTSESHLTASENSCNEEIIEKENDSEEEKKVCNKRQQLSSDFDHIISEVKKKKGPSEKGQKR